MRALDVSGKTFGLLRVLRPEREGGRKKWACECACGNIILTYASSLVKGTSKSCGCTRKEKLIALKLRHGKARTPEYNVWVALVQRCTNPRDKAFKNYGGRGITVCERWKEDFAAFISDMGQRPSQRHSIDRIDNNRGYHPDNCRWATPSEQANNTSRCRRVTYRGRSMSITAAARLAGIVCPTIAYQRLRSGWAPIFAIEIPKGTNRHDPDFYKRRAIDC